MQRRLRPVSAARRLEEALNVYVADDYPACIRALQAVARRLPASTPAETDRRALCRQVLNHAALPDAAPLPAETVLLAFAALHVLLAAHGP
jgi:hypothetical protein